MGLDKPTAQWLSTKGNFGDLLTIGRQNWWLTKREASTLNTICRPVYARDNYADLFFTERSTSYTTIDLVDTEQPTFTYDLSTPVADQWHNSFDTVVEAGTGEHIADQKTFWHNLHAMLRLGGRLLVILPANNVCGHGLWQYSPEFFSAFNSFTCEDLRLAAYGMRVRVERISPSGRFKLSTHFPTYVFAELKKIGPFSMPVQFNNATTTGKLLPLHLTRFLLNIPGFRLIERLKNVF